MKRKVRNFALEIKAIDEKGAFSGYGSVYDTIDAYNERVAKGAFATSLKRWEGKGRLPPILWQHDPRQPVGPFTLMREDDRGLYVEGQLLVDEVEKAREARALMRAKAVDGLSIGFDVDKFEYDKEEQIMTLTQIDLWEVSIVTFPANEDARIESVKSLLSEGKMPSLSEFERILCDAGFTRRQAKTIVGQGYAPLLRDVDSGNRRPVDVTSMLSEITKGNPTSTLLKEILA